METFNDNEEFVEIENSVDSLEESSMLWTPTIGSEIENVIAQIPENSRDTIRRESVEVLGHCLPPDSTMSPRTGLIVGYIQSGKTFSFTTVSALAHDNNFQVVIVITGVSKNLFSQTTERLESDLSTEGFFDRKWELYTTDDTEFRRGDPDSIRVHLQRYSDPRIDPRERRSVIIVAMKQRQHLERLVNVFGQLDLSNVPALIIDDEADQASLNIRVRVDEESSTYRRILDLRDNFPLHTYLQYTATPQALLLINLIDLLSPDFAYTLTPGETYTGGSTFFEDYLQRLVRQIPPRDIPNRNKASKTPTDSLLYSLKIFFVGVAAGWINRSNSSNVNRSMMIHPDRRTAGHNKYYQWVRSIKDHWEAILEKDIDDRDRVELLEEFRDAYEDLNETAIELPLFDDIARQLPIMIRETRVHEVNARTGRTPEIPWNRFYSHILVGGQALDRGFTVEGLTVTYMPRPLGVGNADTVQQRARWFGYKAGYLGYCRVFLSDRAIQTYQEYVNHE
ncbi:MAG: Z1 domain-containing protein, partial [Bacteroidota bacterium]